MTSYVLVTMQDGDPTRKRIEGRIRLGRSSTLKPRMPPGRSTGSAAPRAHRDVRIPRNAGAVLAGSWDVERMGIRSAAFAIRVSRSEDSEAIRRVNGAAFGGDRVPDMVDALVAAGDVVASLVADLDGEVVGHVQLSRCWVDARERLVEVVTLSPLAVVPAHQRQGAGTALISASLQTARAEREPAVFLEGDPNFYGTRGFLNAEALGFGRPSPRIPAPGFQVALFDAELPRGPFVYNQTFWTQDCVGLRDPELARVEAELNPRTMTRPVSPRPSAEGTG